MWRTSFFARLHTMCAVRSRREPTRGRTVQGGLDVPFCFGRTLLVSGLIPETFMSRTWQCRCCCPSYKRRTMDKNKIAKNERWCSYAMDEDDGISSEMDDSFSPALGDDWKNWRVDDPEWESVVNQPKIKRKMEGREGQQGQRQSQGSDVGTSDEVSI